MRRAVILAVAIWIATGSAFAERWQVGATLNIDLNAGSVVDRSADDSLDHLSSVGATLRGMASKSWPLFAAAGLDYRLGASSPAGFLYELNLMPLGLGYMLGDHLMVAAMGGVGISQVSGQVEVGAQFPMEARVDLRLGRHLFVTAAGRGLWVLRDSRSDGARSIDVFDEASAGLSLRLGRRYHERSYGSTGDGYYLGVVASEARGSRTWLGVVGYGMDIMMQRLRF